MDPLLEHFMPSLMALKKALPGRQPGSFRESFISVKCFYKVQKQKNIKGNLKLFTKEKRLKGDALRKRGSTLNTCVHAHGNNVEFFMKILAKIITPLYNSIVL